MGGALRKLFNLYPGEEKKAGLFAILAFLWSLGGYGFLTLSEGMFLEHVGAHALPPVYLGNAVSMCLLSAFLLFALQRLSLHILLTWVLLGAIACNTILYLLLVGTSFPHAISFWYLFKILGWIIPVSTYICFWAFVDQYYDLQDAKRLFCLFNSMTFLGDACAGGLISQFLETLGLSNLLILFIFLMMASLPLIFIILRRVSRVSGETAEEVLSPPSFSPSSFVKTILKSRFTCFLMAFYFVMQLVLIATEYNYMESLDHIFKARSQENSLTEFLGTCGMWVSLANMLFGLLFYSRLVKKIGVSNIVLIPPSFILTIFIAWFWVDALPIAILGLVAREGMAYSFDDNNLNLLVSGVPTKVKNQVRIAIESFFEPFGMLISALLLMALQKQSRTLGFLLALLALGIVLFLRTHYHRAIFRNLVANSIRFEKKASDWIASFSKREKKEVEFHLLSKLRKAEEPTQLLAYEYLLKFHNPRLLPRLLNQFSRLSISGKLRAIDLLEESYCAKENIVIEHLERWRRVLPHPSIKSSIHFYFARYSLLRPEKVLGDLQHAHLGLRGAAILSLKTGAKDNPSYTHLATENLKTLLQSDDEQELCMGIRILGMEKQSQNLEQLVPFLQHSSPFVQRVAAKSIASVATPEWHIYASRLVSRLLLTRDVDMRMAHLEALEKFQDAPSIKSLILSTVHFRPNERKRVERIILTIGKTTIQDLLALVQDSTIHVRCRLLAGKILGKLSLRDLRLHLYPLVQEEMHRAYFYFYHSQTIHGQLPDEDLSILESTLYTGFEGIIDFIIQLLGVAGSIEESEILSHTLRSKNRKIRAQAIETIQRTCDPRIFALLEPLIDDRKPEERLRFYLKQGGAECDLPELLDTLAHSGSVADQIVSLSFKARLNAPGWKEALRKKLDSGEEIFHHFAHELLKTQHTNAIP